MLQSIKKYLWVVFLAGGLAAAWGFSLGGPGIGGGAAGDAWEVPAIGYGLGGDVNTPKALGQGYRRNTPVMVYAMNANFLTYYGSNGVAAVDGAYAILNSLTNVSSYSPSLSEFPLTSQHFNYTAQSLFLTDLKSVTLGLMVEQLGLADPVRYDWTLRDRVHINGDPPCPQGMEYFVLQRNLDASTSPVYTPYINGTLYTYTVGENCNPPNPLAQTIPTPADPFAQIYSPVASLDVEVGTFYSGLTRDDVAGLRYLLTSNNIVTESPAAGSVQLLTNSAPQELQTTLSFNTLAGQAQTNSPAQLQALYPNLVIVSSAFYFTNIPTPNIVITLKQVNGAPAGTFKTVITTNGFTPNYSTNYTYVFGNIYTNSYSANSLLTIATTTVKTPVGSTVGTPGVTNTTITKTLVNQPGGEFFLLPAAWCGFKIVSTLGTQVITLTNSSITLSNVVGGTNVFSGTQVTYSSFTNHTYVIQPSTCTAAPDAATLRMGIENIKFVKANFDSLLTQLFQPITNYYSMATVSNSQRVVRYYRRIVTAPDFLFTGTDQSSINNASIATRNLNFNQANILPGLAGPGTINPATTIDLNTDAPIFETDTTVATIAGETNQIVALAWGSFDASTNDPVVYPDGTSIANLQNQILARITPSTLPAGTNNVPYPVTTFTMTGGSFQAPFTWSLLPPSVLPQGLSLSAGGTISGTPSGNPPGIYDFIIQVTDSVGRTVNWSYSINIPQ